MEGEGGRERDGGRGMRERDEGEGWRGREVGKLEHFDLTSRLLSWR